MLLTTSATCSSNDNEEESSSSSLTLNGSYVKNYSSVTGEWDGRSTAVNNFSFWVNGLEVLAKEDGIYIQGGIDKLNTSEVFNLRAGEDVTKRTYIILEYLYGKGYVYSKIGTSGYIGNKYFDDYYRAGSLIVQSIDKTQHIVVLQFNNLTFDSSDDDDTSIDKLVLNGTLSIHYDLISE